MSESSATNRPHAPGNDDTGAERDVDISDDGRARADADRAGDDPAGASAEDALGAARREAAENWDRYLRAVAELDNVRKRAQRDVEKAHKFAVERLAVELLSVTDSLEAGLAAADSADAAALREGSEATLKLLLTTLEKFGVTAIDPLGEPFDPQQHEAMTMVPAPNAEPDTVVDVVQKGYLLNGRLIRPARVIVAAPPGS
jgi:molecular chaperone GrpE